MARKLGRNSILLTGIVAGSYAGQLRDDYPKFADDTAQAWSTFLLLRLSYSASLSSN